MNQKHILIIEYMNAIFLRDLLHQRTPSFLFEFFPPKSDEAFDALVDMIRELQRLRPTLVSVTYGAGGGTCRRAVDVAAKAKANWVRRAWPT